MSSVYPYRYYLHASITLCLSPCKLPRLLHKPFPIQNFLLVPVVRRLLAELSVGFLPNEVTMLLD